MFNRIEHDSQKIVYQPEGQVMARVILAHGAGAGNRHEFMEQYASLLASHDIEVHSINFPYMQMAYDLAKKRPPNSNKLLIEYYQTLVTTDDASVPLFIAGKSMGGRIATQVLSIPEVSDKVTSAIVLGYPFMPPGKPDKLRERMKHFSEISTPVLILQGERDNFGNRLLLEQQSLPELFSIEWVPSGDHSFKPLKSSGLTTSDNLHLAASKSIEFIHSMIQSL